jgi:tetratricopeptide (TPR) repeat protein
MKHTVFSLLILVLSISGMQAQGIPSDEEMAMAYVETGECELALIYFRKLFESNKSKEIYESYLTCLKDQQAYKEAIDVVKSFQKTQPENPLIMVDMGTVYEAMGEDKKAEKKYQEAIDKVQSSQYQIIALANRFIQMNELDLAHETYVRGKKTLKGSYTFHYELATLEGQRGNIEGMIDEYLILIEINPAYLNTVQNALARNFDFKEENEKTTYLREALLKKVQSYPDNVTYAEMLIWSLVQQKDFYGAFVQARALDMRLRENGYRVLNIGRLSKNNKAYPTAIKCFRYVESLGPENPYFIFSIAEMLEVKQMQLNELQPQITMDEMDGAFRNAMDQVGINKNTAKMLQDWAHFKAYRRFQLDTAVILLERGLAIPALFDKVEAGLKLELADVLLIQNEVWDASLLYLQVDKQFKNDLIGQEAKFRNARLYYYTGNFNWAKAQLDVLKASTSKLIANDAMALSLLISDNLALDTITLPLERFAQADLLYAQYKDSAALEILDSLTMHFPGHPLLDEIAYKRFEIALRNLQLDEAVEQLKYIIEVHPNDILADKALFQWGKLEEEVFFNPEEAARIYQQLLELYPNSLFVEEARTRFRRLRGDALN